MNKELLGSIREECVASVKDLLEVHASDLDTALEMLEGAVTVNVGFAIDITEVRPKIKTKIAFYINRCKDERETVLDDGQTKLFE